MKIKIEDYKKYLQLKQIKVQAENRVVIEVAKNRISSRSLWNFFLEQDEETTLKWIEYLQGKRNAPNRLTLPRSISIPFKVFYYPQENFKKELEMVKYIENNELEDFIEVDFEKGREIVDILSSENTKHWRE